MVEVRSGEVVPVDGIITSGGGSIDRAPLTGEPVPVLVSEGDFVEAGLTLVRGPIVLRSVATGENTRLSNLVELVREYRDKPTRTHTTIENFTRIWVPIVLLGSGIPDFTTALGCFMPMLVVASRPNTTCRRTLHCLCLWGDSSWWRRPGSNCRRETSITG